MRFRRSGIESKQRLMNRTACGTMGSHTYVKPENLTVNSSRYSNGWTPIERITGDTPDVSEYIDFGFYDWVVYC